MHGHVSSVAFGLLSAGDSTSMDVLQHHSSKLTDAISKNLSLVINELCSEKLISRHKKSEILTTAGLSSYDKSTNLVMFIESELEASLNPDQYLIDICHVLIRQENQTLISIATSMLQQLGKYNNHVYIINITS